MIITIIFLVMTLLITLDSIGSKRLRARVIRLGKQFFARATTTLPTLNKDDLPELLQAYLGYACAKKAAPIQNLRMKIKGAVQKQGRTNWYPIEAKLFLTTTPEQLLYYEDRTMAFLGSQKSFHQLEPENNLRSRAILSLFPQTTAPVVLNKMQEIASVAWRPDWLLHQSLIWTVSEATVLTTQQGGIAISLHIDIDSGKLLACHCSDTETGATVNFQYSDFEEVEAYLVPMTFDVRESYSGKEFIYRFQVTELIYNEDFAWW